MGKYKGAGDYPTTTINTGLYGSSTTNKNGTVYSPNSFQQNLTGSVEKYVPNILNEYINPSYNSETYLAEKAQRQNQQRQAYDTGVLSSVANRGLMRSSGLQSATNAFADTLANQEVQAMQNYQADSANKLAALMGLYEIPYNMMKGTNGSSQSLSNAIANYNLKNQKFQGKNSELFGTIGSAIGTVGGAILGGPSGAQIGGQLGKAAGNTVGSL